MTNITLPTRHGALDFSSFNYDGQEGVVILNEAYEGAPFVRIHSSCLFSESLGTLDCDCALQLQAALKHVGANGGIVVYLYQEGRGIGLKRKIEAIGIQQRDKVDTVAAFATLGHKADPRSYVAATKALLDMGITAVVLDTSNPQKIEALTAAGIKVEKRIKLEIETSPLVDAYVREKQIVLGHHGDD